MKNGIQEVIEKLEQQRTAIERALTALRGVEGTEEESSEKATVSAPLAKATKKGGMTAAGRKRLSEALRRRWAAKKAGTAPAPNAKASAPVTKKKGGMTPEGRKRLSEALRKRWAAKRAGQPATAKKAARK